MPMDPHLQYRSRAIGRVDQSTSERHVGAWTLVEQIGLGRWSRVYAARPRDCPATWPADYAVKIAQADKSWAATSRRLLEREHIVASQVVDPHVITVLEASISETLGYLVMPRLEGSTVRAALDAHGRFSAPHALWIARQVAQALAALHTAGWLHGDVKPDNIMVSPAGHATLFDLGFALKLRSSECRTDGEIRGTMAYTAPEMISASALVDQSADIYSLGITLYEMLTGQIPFPSRQMETLLRAHLEEPLPNARRAVPSLPSEVQRLIKRMTAKQPLRRPSADELVWQLAELEIEVFDDRVA